MNLNDINPITSSQRMNNFMETRFGFKLDFSRLSYKKADQLHRLVGENIDRIRRSYGIHTAEKNPKYMELLMVREGLGRWMRENQNLMESEMGRSEAILAAKDMVDSIQDMVEKVNRMQVEQLPALIDTIRDQIGMSEADNFKSAMTQLLTDVSTALGQARETADSNARSLAGEETMAAPDAGAGDLAAPSMGEPSDLDIDTVDDDFAATDAEAGGTEPLGREKR